MASAKKARAEAQNVAKAIKSYNVPYYVADVALEESLKFLETCGEAVKKQVLLRYPILCFNDCSFLQVPTSGVMLLSAGVNKLVVLAFVPEDKTSQVTSAYC